MDFDFGEQVILQVENFEAESPHQDESSSFSDEEDETHGSSSEDEPLPTKNKSSYSADDIPIFTKDAIRLGKNLLVECPPGRERRMKILQGALEYYKWTKDRTEQKFDEGMPETPLPAKIYLGVRNLCEAERVFMKLKNKFEGSGLLTDIQVAIIGRKRKNCENDRQDTIGECEQSSELFYSCEDQDMYDTHLSSKEMEEESYYEGSHERLNDKNKVPGEADLVICLVEHLLSPVRQKENGVNLKNAVVIIDDGHDIERLCMEEGSTQITSHELRKASSVLRRVIADYQSTAKQNGNRCDDPSVMQRLAGLVEPLMELSDYIMYNAKEDGGPGREEVLERLSELPISLINSVELHPVLSELAAQSKISPQTYEILLKLDQFLTALSLTLKYPDDYSFQVFIEDLGANITPPTLYLLCANSAILLREVEKSAVSLILGGYCLAPIDSLKEELGVNFHEILEITHSSTETHAARERYLLGYCSRGPSDTEFHLDYELRGKLETQLEVCRSILEICKVIPNGVVVLIHSPRFARMLWNTLENRTGEGGKSMLSQIGEVKHVINLLSEPETEAEKELCKYKQLCRKTGNDAKNGAVLFLVARGFLWKNVDLKGEELRGIIQVSVPFGANIPECNTQAYIDHLDRQATISYSDPEELYLQWYRSEAFRDLNQSFARAVRDDKDWGVVVVLDSWMHSKRHEFNSRFLPAWVSNLQLLRQYQFNELTESIQKFVTRCRQIE